jgi:hypothetical protein
VHLALRFLSQVFPHFVPLSYVCGIRLAFSMPWCNDSMSISSYMYV